jgi:hypothetical protein
MKTNQLTTIYPEIDCELFEEASYYLIRLENLWGEDFLDGSDGDICL